VSGAGNSSLLFVNINETKKKKKIIISAAEAFEAYEACTPVE